MNHLKNTRFIFDKYAGTYKEKYLDQGNYAGMLLEFLEGIPKGGRVLDLGCGPGNISRFLLDHRGDLALTGIDIAPGMIREARELNPEGTFYEGNVLDIEALVQGRFDGVVSGFVLPYLDDEQVRLHLNHIAALLKPEGVCYLSFLHGDKKESGFAVSNNSDGETLFMHYHPIDLVEHTVESISGITLKKTFTSPFFKGEVAQPEGVKKTPRSENGEPTNMEIMMILRSS